jgi:hypothetical protein
MAMLVIVAPRWNHLGRLQQRTGHQELLLLAKARKKKCDFCWEKEEDY